MSCCSTLGAAAAPASWPTREVAHKTTGPEVVRGPVEALGEARRYFFRCVSMYLTASPTLVIF